jgi:phasin family protein
MLQCSNQLRRDPVGMAEAAQTERGARYMAAKAKTPEFKDAFGSTEAAALAGREAMESMMKVGSDLASQSYEKSLAMSREQVEKLFGSAGSSQLDEVAAQGKANADAVLQATSVVAKGFEEMSRAWMGLAQRQMEANLAGVQAVMGARNMQDAVELQASWLKGNVDTLMSEGVKLSEMAVDVGTKAWEPLNGRLNATTAAAARTATRANGAANS